MTKPTTKTMAPAADMPPKRRRLTAEARKSSILDAARRAFIETCAFGLVASHCLVNAQTTATSAIVGWLTAASRPLISVRKIAQTVASAMTHSSWKP